MTSAWLNRFNKAAPNLQMLQLEKMSFLDVDMDDMDGVFLDDDMDDMDGVQLNPFTNLRQGSSNPLS